jgi:hypothetical protein
VAALKHEIYSTRRICERDLDVSSWPEAEAMVTRLDGRFLGISCIPLTQPNETQHLVPKISFVFPPLFRHLLGCVAHKG